MVRVLLALYLLIKKSQGGCGGGLKRGAVVGRSGVRGWVGAGCGGGSERGAGVGGWEFLVFIVVPL